jgi:hypothetical protein
MQHFQKFWPKTIFLAAFRFPVSALKFAARVDVSDGGADDGGDAAEKVAGERGR